MPALPETDSVLRPRRLSQAEFEAATSGLPAGPVGIFEYKGGYYDGRGRRIAECTPEPKLRTPSFLDLTGGLDFSAQNLANHYMDIDRHIRSQKRPTTQTAVASQLAPHELIASLRQGIRENDALAMKASPALRDQLNASAYDNLTRDPLLGPQIQSFLSPNIDYIVPGTNQSRTDALAHEVHRRKQLLNTALQDRLSGRLTQYIPAHESGVELPEDRICEIVTQFDPKEFQQGYSALAVKNMLSQAQKPGEEGKNASSVLSTLMGNKQSPLLN